jgi:hypothetical protein
MQRPLKDFSVRTIRKLVISNPAITVNELMVAAKEAGNPLKRSTVRLARNQALDFIANAKESGHWVD